MGNIISNGLSVIRAYKMAIENEGEDMNSELCSICPRKCRIDRALSKGFCGAGSLLTIAKAYLHKWEEPCISGCNGSGTVFFSGCNLKCSFCQNYRISQENFGRQLTINELSEVFLALQKSGAHNINLVNPTHFAVQIRETVIRTPDIDIPIVYNSNGYEGDEVLELMDGVVDVYLPDIKYYSSAPAYKYSSASDYFEIAAQAVLEMYRQVGYAVLDENGIMKKGLIIRHLILPGLSGESIKILNWIEANLPDDVYVSLMSQYTPYYKAEQYPEINRRITRREYERVVNHFLKLGFKNGYIQERESAQEHYIPDFDLEGIAGGEQWQEADDMNKT